MLRLPNSIDEIDPLPPFDNDPLFRLMSNRQWEELSALSAGSNETEWLPIKGKPNLYTRAGKLKYAPPEPETREAMIARLARPIIESFGGTFISVGWPTE